MNLRVNAPKDIFVGNSASSKVIEEQTKSGNWEQFFPCLGDKRTISKPHGISPANLFGGIEMRTLESKQCRKKEKKL